MIFKNFHKTTAFKIYGMKQMNEVIFSKYANLHWLSETTICVMEASEITIGGKYRATQCLKPYLLYMYV